MKPASLSEDFKKAMEIAQEKNLALPVKATVEDGLERWMKVHSIGNKPRTIDFNRDLVKIIRSNWPDLKTPIASVTQDQCVTFAESVGHYASSRYNGIVNAIRSFIPAARFIPRKKIKLPDVSTACPTPAEFDRLLAALDAAKHGNSGLVVRFLAHTGFRQNEARQLLWSDVKDDHIYARGEVTKSGQPRTVPFIQGTREVLRALRRVSPQKVIPHGSCHTALSFASRLTGLPKFGHHTFRHYFATRCIVSGVDIPTVAKWLGHSDNGCLLLKIYCHLMDEHSRAMAEKVRLGANLANPEHFVRVHESRAETNPVLKVEFGARALGQ